MAHYQRLIDNQTSQVTPSKLIPRNIIISAYQQNPIWRVKVPSHRITSNWTLKER
jgi:hypothetical protein